jgi:hypothetical protein
MGAVRAGLSRDCRSCRREHPLGFDERDHAVDIYSLSADQNRGIGLECEYATPRAHEPAQLRGKATDIGADLDNRHTLLNQRTQSARDAGFPTAVQDDLRCQRKIAYIDEQPLPINRCCQHSVANEYTRLAADCPEFPIPLAFLSKAHEAAGSSKVPGISARHRSL